MVNKLNFASAICQIFGYISLVGVAMMWYNLSVYVGVTFLISSIFAMILIRTAMMPDKIE
jgi:hypothetical protein